MQIRSEDIISNLLANVLDWDSNDLRSDFINYLKEETSVSPEKLASIFDDYLKIPTLERESPHFDTLDFVSKYLD